MTSFAMHTRVDTIVDALDAVLGGAGQRQRLGDILGAALRRGVLAEVFYRHGKRLLRVRRDRGGLRHAKVKLAQIASARLGEAAHRRVTFLELTHGE